MNESMMPDYGVHSYLDGAARHYDTLMDIALMEAQLTSSSEWRHGIHINTDAFDTNYQTVQRNTSDSLG